MIVISSFGSHAIDIEQMQAVFSGGKIVNLIGDYAIYTSSTAEGLKYGVCFYDEGFEPRYSFATNSLNGSVYSKVISNSKCYTVIPAIFEAIQPVSEGSVAVCMDKKWAYLDLDCNYLTDFCFEAAMPVKNSIAKVSIDKKIHNIPVSDLKQYSSADAVDNSYKHKDILLKQLLAEEQIDKCLEIGKNNVSQNLPDAVEDYSPQHFQFLLCMQGLAASARNKGMATTVGLMDNPKFSDKFKPAYIDYRNTKLTENFSCLRNNPSLAREVVRRCFSEIKRKTPALYSKLSKVYEDFSKSDFKKAIYKYELLMDSEDLKGSEICDLLYSSLLHLAGDFETYNKVDYFLTADKRTIDDPVLTTVSDALGLKYKSAESRIKALLQNKGLKSGDKIFLMSLLAQIYAEVGLQNEAFTVFEDALKVSDSSGNSEMTLGILSNAVMTAATCDEKKLRQFLPLFMKTECDYDVSLFSSMNILQLSKEWGLSRARIDNVVNSLIKSNNQEYLYNAYKLSMYMRNLLHDSQLDWYGKANQSNDQEIRRMYDLYSDLRASYEGVDIYNLSGEYDDKVIKMMDLESNIKKRLPKPVGLYDKYFGDVIAFAKENIDKNSCVVEFFEYQDQRLKMLGAWVFDKTLRYPKFYPITDTNNLKKYNKTSDESIKQAYSANGKLIWETLPVSDYKTIYFVPSSFMADMGMEYFDYKGEPLVMSCNMHRISSIFNIPAAESRIDQGSKIALFGGLDYGTSFTSNKRGGLRTGFLQYSLNEVNEIERLLGDIVAVKKFTGKKGTPETYRNLKDIHPDVIHIATHGYQRGSKPIDNFVQHNRFNYYRQNTDLEDEDWLLSSTGFYLSEDQAMPDSLNNRLLSKEIALTRLEDTALVVLSACDTSSGEKSDGYDFVLGLNYAFQKASVKNIISSLWNVYDNYTFDFMTSFYSKLTENNVHDAFTATVREFKVKYPDQPTVWSSFILTENQ